ncbi:DMT family transporter [Streptomyces sp. NBC_00820]|uniref:DMT family transporter n=1 Tax=Streptomyces sp. NBC_00820 TaxID=2975842 RepID=UPI002ED558E1|nr:DMT family transporter [Streptomyces sp. NBC_00820]
MSALALSVLLSFVSAVAYAGGAIVQEQVALSCPDGQYVPLRRPGWWAALALNGLGGVLHVVALAYGPLSLVQPLGALTIVFALPMAALCVGRRAGAAAWRGAIMATAGLAGLLSLVGSGDSHSLDTAQRIAVAVATGAVVVALMAAGRAAHRHPAVRSALLATGAGAAFGMSSVFTKTVAVDWTDGVALSDLPSLAVIALFSVAGVMLSQASYRGGGLASPLATLTVVNPVLAAAVGILMFGETFRHGSTGTLLALACGVVAGGGLILLTTERLEGAAGAGAGADADLGTGADTGAGADLGTATGTTVGTAVIPATAPRADGRAAGVPRQRVAPEGEPVRGTTESAAAAVGEAERDPDGPVPGEGPLADGGGTDGVRVPLDGALVAYAPEGGRERAGEGDGVAPDDARALLGVIPEGVPDMIPDVTPDPAPDLIPDLALNLDPDLDLNLDPDLDPDFVPDLVPDTLPGPEKPLSASIPVPLALLDRHRAQVRS